MVKTIEFNQNGDDLFAEVAINDLAIVSYSLRLFSISANEEKVVQKEIGNNLRNDDDTFRLRSNADPQEPVSNHDGRFVSLMTTIDTNKPEAHYVIELKIFQGNPTVPGNLLDSVTEEGDVSITDGGLTKNLGVILKANA